MSKVLERPKSVLQYTGNSTNGVLLCVEIDYIRCILQNLIEFRPKKLLNFVLLTCLIRVSLMSLLLPKPTSGVLNYELGIFDEYLHDFSVPIQCFILTTQHYYYSSCIIHN